ncbi:MAG: uroporphyrinogen-III C-methyltransferase [Parvibaculum sp.]|jgi:uroporphyrin-III C-methyltransferase|uniref:uroporphyrinogen-III C-methyltransferase n=1 Tax=Parvibaculum sp. TaxID=2024848 RepID=UPI000C407263|nr:uroporphyrinogen-III C-methyltransferase [Parvibaculum sp.]MAU62367.1 uroporphyrinogen-III C-methyltransferase [Parvibaculum sp.]|tara:strand:- start:2228 stop:3133 length:906 start_codon:yes stop_codon:yes gene_type:complete
MSNDKVISLTGRKSRPLPDGVGEAASALGLPAFEPGWVWLVGAGPGDPGLLTLHALNALRQADVVVYDALVDETVLQFAAPHAKLEYSGKRGGKPSPKQRDISAKLVELARSGKRVLRLKGGDPFVFGRGGEEALALVDAGIPFRLVPGVTAGVGGLGYAGIPVTHRDVNHAVTFVTGHMAGGNVPENLDWPSIAKGSPVIVLYMALSHLGEISRLLIENGRSANEPVALVRNATLKDQTVLETTLGRAVEDVARAEFKAPAIIVIGDVVKLREGLDWLGALESRILKRDPLGLRGIEDAG